MYSIRNVTEDIFWVGGNDQRITRFENLHELPHGVSYNSYLLMDDKTVLFDTVDWSIARDYLRNVKSVLKGRQLDYLIVNHMEPDHCSAIELLLKEYPTLQIYSTKVAFQMMRQFGYDVEGHENIVKEGDTLNSGHHNLKFIEAPMVHWPEVIVTYDEDAHILFSADAFGTFGTLDGKLFDEEFRYKEHLYDEARRYYTNIVGKYGTFVQRLFKKIENLTIDMICPLHGPTWRGDRGRILDKYIKWSTNTPEDEGVIVVYSSMYGNTESIAQSIASKLADKGIHNVMVYDVSSTDSSLLVSETFRVGHVVLASTTYNGGIFPLVSQYLHEVKSLEIQNRTFALLENGTWGPNANRPMRKALEETKNNTILEKTLSVRSTLQDEADASVNEFVDAIIESIKATA